jgi:hypothetical protein
MINLEALAAVVEEYGRRIGANCRKARNIPGCGVWATGIGVEVYLALSVC